ncbi:hypothetical protein [Bradyrhizobium sp. USDA 4473]
MVGNPATLKDSFTVMGMAEQRPVLAARDRGVGSAGRVKAALEIAHAHRVDLAVMALDAADRILRELDGRDLFLAQRRRQFDGGLETVLRFGHWHAP